MSNDTAVDARGIITALSQEIASLTVRAAIAEQRVAQLEAALAGKGKK
nr:MAG TPA: hypothetical protein [Caudoviricetes sp.]